MDLMGDLDQSNGITGSIEWARSINRMVELDQSIGIIRSIAGSN